MKTIYTQNPDYLPYEKADLFVLIPMMESDFLVKGDLVLKQVWELFEHPLDIAGLPIDQKKLKDLIDNKIIIETSATSKKIDDLPSLEKLDFEIISLPKSQLEVYAQGWPFPSDS